MYYYGMLTIRGSFGLMMKLSIPNNNIRKQYYRYILDHYCEVTKVNTNEMSICFANAALLGKWKEMFMFIADRFKQNSSNRSTIEGEKIIHEFYMACMSFNPYYLMCPEIEFNHGYCDIFLMPDKRFKDVKHSFIVEFKYVNTNSSAQEVLKKFEEAAAQLNFSTASGEKLSSSVGKYPRLACIKK